MLKIEIMIAEDYCNFETAKLLKEKGFNEPCYSCYLNKELSHYDYLSTNFELIDDVISAPTLQIVMKWLREEYKFLIIIDLGIGAYVWTITNIDEYKIVQMDAIVGSYEQACEAAIKYCLENLI